MPASIITSPTKKNAAGSSPTPYSANSFAMNIETKMLKKISRAEPLSDLICAVLGPALPMMTLSMKIERIQVTVTAR
jgi:hypothetical protein